MCSLKDTTSVMFFRLHRRRAMKKHLDTIVVVVVVIVFFAPGIRELLKGRI